MTFLSPIQLHQSTEEILGLTVELYKFIIGNSSIPVCFDDFVDDFCW